MANKKRFSLFELASFFIDSFIGGVKNHLKMFIGLCGFLSAIGAVFAASNLGQSFFRKSEPVTQEEKIEYPEPNHDNLVPSRKPASAKLIAVNTGRSRMPSPQANSGAFSNESSSGGGLSPEAGGPTHADVNTGSFGTVSGSSSSGSGSVFSGGSFGSNSGQSTGSTGTSNSGSGTAPAADTAGALSGDGGRLPATTSGTTTSFSTNDLASNPSLLSQVPTAGAFIFSGAGSGTGTNLSVRASVGAVISNNYTANSQFVLISGVAGFAR